VLVHCGAVTVMSSVKVGAKDAVSVYYWIVPESLGQIPIEVSATSSAAGDAVRRQLLVKVIQPSPLFSSPVSATVFESPFS